MRGPRERSRRDDTRRCLRRDRQQTASIGVARACSMTRFYAQTTIACRHAEKEGRRCKFPERSVRSICARSMTRIRVEVAHIRRRGTGAQCRRHQGPSQQAVGQPHGAEHVHNDGYADQRGYRAPRSCTSLGRSRRSPTSRSRWPTTATKSWGRARRAQPRRPLHRGRDVRRAERAVRGRPRGRRGPTVSAPPAQAGLPPSRRTPPVRPSHHGARGQLAAEWWSRAPA
jgi:hypothetical protein